MRETIEGRHRLTTDRLTSDQTKQLALLHRTMSAPRRSLPWTRFAAATFGVIIIGGMAYKDEQRVPEVEMHWKPPSVAPATPSKEKLPDTFVRPHFPEDTRGNAPAMDIDQ
ncbi:MAG: hypothetical protein ACREHC_01095 [Candidatus Levyibacteriota bacterium]